MAVDLNTLARKSSPRPPMVYLYGVGGIGKTTFASYAPRPVFLMTEDGLMSPHLSSCDYLARADKDANNRLVRTYEEMCGWLDLLATGNHDYESVVIDSLDAFEPHVWKQTCENHGWKSIETPGYGKGYLEAEALWRDFLARVMRLRNERNMTVIMIGHNTVTNVQMPDSEPYNQYSPAMHKRAAKLVYNESDCVLFAMRPVQIVTDKGKFNTDAQKRAIADDNVRLYTQERGGWMAKNRYDMPAWIPFEWPVFASYVPYLNAGVAATPQADAEQQDSAA